MMKKTFINAQEMHQAYPATFEVPSDKELSEIAVGDFVKVGVEGGEDHPGERFWIEVLKINSNGDLEGTVDNDLLLTDSHGWSDKDPAKVRLEEVYSIFKMPKTK